MNPWKALMWILWPVLVLRAGAQGEDELLSGLGGMMKEMTSEMSGTGTAVRVESSVLQTVLPSALPGFRRVEVSGGRGQDLAAAHSTARGRYEGRSGSAIELSLQDLGTNGAATAWTRMGFRAERSKSGPGGVDRTWTYQGRPAAERYETARKSGEIHVLSGGRFIVRISGTGVDAIALQQALKAVDLSKLDRLPRGAGADPAPR
jgi:hypothetical protein